MGLDITAYRKLIPSPEAATDSAGDPIDWKELVRFHKSTLEFTEKSWPGRSGAIEPGIYGFAEAFRFRAGSYGRYNAWRDWLAKISGWGSAKECWDSQKTEGPFYELINFADNEGVIGPEATVKLAKDFAEFQSQAERMATDGYDLEKYNEWRKAFELASDAGAVDFH